MQDSISPPTATTVPLPRPSPPAPLQSRKPFFSRVNENNRILGNFLGCFLGLILGIVLVTQHRVSVSIIGVPSTPFLDVLTVMLAAGAGGNTCSFIGTCFDTMTGERTVFDGIKAVYDWCRGKSEKEEE